MAIHEFHLPDVGEGLTEAEIVAWHVAPGDTVAINDIIVEIETAKSVVELPCPYSGVVAALHGEVGQTLDVGTLLITVGDSASEPAPAPSAEPPAPVEAAVPESAPEAKPLVLVGTAPKEAEARKRRLSGRASAKPPVRALAKTLGVDLERLAHADDSPISREEVETAAGRHPDVDAAVAAPAPGRALDASDGDVARETRSPIKGVRRVMADAMTKSAFTAPHVTLFHTVDVTATMDLLADLKQDREWQGRRVTGLLLVAKALLLTTRRFPGINDRWDEKAQEVVRHGFVNLGVAVASPRGLLVPNIKDAHGLALSQLADALDELVDKARSGKTQPADMTGGTITITNIGALGVDAGTPLLNPGESAILAFGAVRERPWVVDGEMVIRKVTELSLSFDHRLVDGQLGAAVLTELANILSDPRRAMLYA